LVFCDAYKKRNIFLFDSNVTFTTPAAVCRYLARAASSANPQTLYYGASILEQAEVCECRYLFNFTAHVTFSLEYFLSQCGILIVNQLN